MEEKEYPNFLPFFFNEPVYVVSEPAPFIPEKPSPKEHEIPAVEKIPIRGENKRHILVVVEEAYVEFISQTDEQLLHNILKAVHCSLNDIAFINLRNVRLEPAFISQALENIPFRVFISFGGQIPPGPLSNFFSKYVVSRDDAGRKFLLADRLSELASDPYKKKKLWQCLQQLF